ELCSLDFHRNAIKSDPIIYVREGWGNKTPGVYWQKGVYLWEAWIEGEKVDTVYFYVEDAEKDMPSDKNPYIAVESLRLYEGPWDEIPRDEHIYYREFSGEDTRYIYADIILKNLNTTQDWQCEIFTKFYNNARSLKGEIVKIQQVDAGTETIIISAGWGSEVKGSWGADQYTAEIIFFDKLIASIAFKVGDSFVKDNKVAFKNYTVEDKKDTKVKILKVPEKLKTGIQQYLLFFKDYVETAKGKDVNFNVKKVDDGLELEIESEEDDELIQQYFDEYLSFAKDSFIGTINVEGEPSPESIDILRMRLEQQVHNLNMEIKFKDLQIKSLEGQVVNSQKEKVMLLEMVSNSINHTIEVPTTHNSHDDIRHSCEHLIKRGEIEATMKVLVKFSENNPNMELSKDIILIKSNWTNIKRNSIRGQSDQETLDMEKARLVNSILSVLDML
ncbi:MAG: hypothetical protein AAGI23_16160, partial [Bacteroidota bacterium]